MAVNHSVCPICRTKHEHSVLEDSGRGDARILCQVCGEYCLSGSAFDLNQFVLRQDLSARQRAALSHRIRLAQEDGGSEPFVSTDWIKRLVAGEIRLPTPAEQVTNIIRYVGDQISQTGESLRSFGTELPAIIGSFNRDQALQIVRELSQRGMISSIDAGDHDSRYELIDINLLLDGWDYYESERRGAIAGNYGFIVLQFNDDALDRFISEVVRPTVEDVGYSLEDMRGLAEAGIIDNVMRARIRDAAFVLVDLTHANRGAYWEAGYAEGLGKPVLYLCEKSVFENKGTHFDTNHCTTVIWDEEEPEAFSQELAATLRRSLGLFEN